MSERSNEPVLKTGEAQASGGSNPSPSATPWARVPAHGVAERQTRYRGCLRWLHVTDTMLSARGNRPKPRGGFCGFAQATAIQVDNGTEFICNHFDCWAHARGVRLEFSGPTDNPYIESFNGRLRDECLNVHWISGVDDARRKIEDWRRDYNETRPRSSLGGSGPGDVGC